MESTYCVPRDHLVACRLRGTLRGEVPQVVGRIGHNESMIEPSVSSAGDNAEVSKTQGASFAPDAITRLIVDWVIHDANDTVSEPSAIDTAFFVKAVGCLRELGCNEGDSPRAVGIQIHPTLAHARQRRVEAPNIRTFGGMLA